MTRIALALALAVSAAALAAPSAQAAVAFQPDQITAANVPGNNPVATRMVVRTPPARIVLTYGASRFASFRSSRAVACATLVVSGS